jgi:hypothetical protein
MCPFVVTASKLCATTILSMHPFSITSGPINVESPFFCLAVLTFLNYPTTLASNNYSWLVQSNWNIGGASMGVLAFFSASVLWDTLIGSLFGFLESWLRLD